MHVLINYRKTTISIVIGAGLILISYGWARKTSVDRIELEVSKGLFCEWKTPFGGRQWPYTSRWKNYFPGSTVASINVDYPIDDSKELGKALSFIGGLKEVAIQQGDSKNVVDLIDALGTQPELEALMIFNVSLPNTICAMLKQFPSLVGLSIVPSTIDGETMLNLEKVEEIDLSYSPVTNRGLEQLLALPKLQRLCLNRANITVEGLTNLKIRGTHVSELYIDNCGLSESSIEKVTARIKHAYPNIAVRISN